MSRDFSLGAVRRELGAVAASAYSPQRQSYPFPIPYLLRGRPVRVEYSGSAMIHRETADPVSQHEAF